MARIPRLVVTGEPAVYHVMSRTALDGFVLGDVEKDFLCDLIRKLSSVYFTEVLGFCVMGNHFHLLVRVHPGSEYDDEDIRRRFLRYYGKDSGREMSGGQIPLFREKWANISEYVKEIKQGFSRFYNRLHHRKGFFWGDRFTQLNRPQAYSEAVFNRVKKCDCGKWRNLGQLPGLHRSQPGSGRDL